MKFARPVAVSIGLLLAQGLAYAEASPPQRSIEFDVPPQSLSSALNVFAKQSDLRVVFYTDVTDRMKSAPVHGTLTPENALKMLLKGANLTYEFGEDNSVQIWSPKELAARRGDGELRLSQAAGRVPNSSASASPADTAASGSVAQSAAAPDAQMSGIPEVLVKGKKSLNADVTRTENDAQPYVVFTREAIQASGTQNVEEFLKSRLPANQVGISQGQVGGALGNMSQINLRGLGADQTLVLIDGRRGASPAIAGGAPGQSDLNSIPLAAIERVEILPTTASGIYGGSATGGVVNIILRRDYSGLEARLNYGNTFDAAAPTRRVDLAGGFDLADGKTSFLVSGSYLKTDPLAMGDRDFYTRGRDRILRNTPALVLNGTNPPLGATPNIRSNTTVGGVVQNLVLDNGTPLNSTFTSVPVGYGGPTTDGGVALVGQAGRYNYDMASSAQPNGGGGASLINGPTEKSLRLGVRQQFGSRIVGFVDLSGFESEGHFITGSPSVGFTIPASAANNPFQQSIRVSVPLPAADTALTVENKDRRAVAGLIAQLPGQWMANFDYTWDRYTSHFSGQPDPVTAAGRAAITSTLDVLRDADAAPLNYLPTYFPVPEYTSPQDSTMKAASVRVAGPVGRLPGGSPKVTVLLERRTENFGEGQLFTSFGNFLFPEQSREINSAYLETEVPIVGEANSRAGLRELQLQLAVRRDEYDTHGTNSFLAPTDPVIRSSNKVNSTDPTIGLKFRPLSSVMLRASYGTGFRPPSVLEIVTNPTPSTNTVIDPRRGNQSTTVQQLAGGNSDLRPEESESTSAGVVFTPSFAEGLRVSLDYTRIKKDDEIRGLLAQQIVDNEALFPGLVTRAAAAPGDPFGVGAITLVNARTPNVARTKLEAYDFSASYGLNTESWGSFDLYLAGSRTMHYESQLIESVAAVENVGVQFNNPLKFKATAGAGWRRGEWSAGWTARYFSSYLVSTNAVVVQSQGGSGRIPSQDYHDVYLGWTPAAFSRMLSQTDLRVGVRNVFNSTPPVDTFASSIGYYSPFADPNLRSYYVNVHVAF